MLAANFAPRGGSHPTRTVHLAKYLCKFGHELKVVTYETAQHGLYAALDETLAAKVPSDVEVMRVPSGLLHRLLGRVKSLDNAPREIKRRAVGNPLTPFLIPDPHCMARRTFRDAGLSVVREWAPDVVLTCAYPYTMTLVGSDIKRWHRRLVWIADYGDPWTGAPTAELKRPMWRTALDRQIESRALRNADAVVLTTRSAAEMYERQFPYLSGRVHTVTMGYDPDDASGIAPTKFAGLDPRSIVLLHAGRLYRAARDPFPFIGALEHIVKCHPELSARLKVILLGEVEPGIVNAIRSSSASGLIHIQGWVPVSDSIALMKGASRLLLFGNRGNLQVPGKVFQYIGAGRPILMIRESSDDPTASIVGECVNSRVCANTEADIVAALRSIPAEIDEGTDRSGAIVRFSWPVLAEQLASIADAARRSITCGA